MKNWRNGWWTQNNYYKDELIFEGEYLNGELRSGKGKECNFRGITEFEGEYINGEKNGIIYENNYSYSIKTDGKYINGLKQGFVKVYSEELKYEGEYVNNEKNGYGKIYKKMN